MNNDDNDTEESSSRCSQRLIPQSYIRSEKVEIAAKLFKRVEPPPLMFKDIPAMIEESNRQWEEKQREKEEAIKERLREKEENRENFRMVSALLEKYKYTTESSSSSSSE
ncbi:2068_t:CDS:2 [Ambispora leptoticha]|uniref:2068_t:CDS:1 n=1 Tax=Ambispora leptoticha TaxID=144679 RepID=A0A9N9H7Q2_9GLOM|nr:2068_t:CDS:2 [Ambispora leptoticha]